MLGSLLITLLLVALVYLLITRSPSKRDKKTSTILIYGLPKTGKTELFYQLLYDKRINTTSSMEINKAKLKVKNYLYDLIDIPGHPSFLGDLKKMIDSNITIIFLIDLSKK